MVRSRLRNKFLKEKTTFSREAYNKQRNYFGNLNVKNITDNKKFWKTVRPNFSSKKPTNENILL